MPHCVGITRNGLKIALENWAVILSPEALSDLRDLYDYIARVSSPRGAAAYLERLELFVRGFGHAAKRGSMREDVRPGLRVVGFERRITIAFTVSEAEVTILRFFYGGQDWERAWRED